jgi:hypothetical protein
LRDFFVFFFFFLLSVVAVFFFEPGRVIVPAVLPS